MEKIRKNAAEKIEKKRRKKEESFTKRLLEKKGSHELEAISDGTCCESKKSESGLKMQQAAFLAFLEDS